jgi:hypothetical protein
MDKKKPKLKPRPPIGEELKIARDQMWNPKLDASKRMTFSDMLMPIDQKPDPKPKKRPLTVIVVLVEEARAVWGDCPATEAYAEKLYQEAGLKYKPKQTKSRDELLDEAMGEDE